MLSPRRCAGTSTLLPRAVPVRHSSSTHVPCDLLTQRFHCGSHDVMIVSNKQDWAQMRYGLVMMMMMMKGVLGGGAGASEGELPGLF